MAHSILMEPDSPVSLRESTTIHHVFLIFDIDMPQESMNTKCAKSVCVCVYIHIHIHTHTHIKRVYTHKYMQNAKKEKNANKICQHLLFLLMGLCKYANV